MKRRLGVFELERRRREAVELLLLRWVVERASQQDVPLSGCLADPLVVSDPGRTFA